MFIDRVNSCGKSSPFRFKRVRGGNRLFSVIEIKRNTDEGEYCETPDTIDDC